ncbi:MAG: hypothetical protein WAQ09_02285 [Bacillota bacterium]|jgi:Cdc6-like AAA superfamily ATPase
MDLNDRKLKQKLKSEIGSIKFSSYQKNQLAEALIAGQKKENLPKRTFHLLSEFWHGTTEIPLYLGAIGLLVLILGVRNTIDIFLIDSESAAFLLQQTVEIIERSGLW